MDLLGLWLYFNSAVCGWITEKFAKKILEK